MGNTGLLTDRCDPYGAESQIKLLGGLYPESYNGKHHWFCAERAVARFRMVCTGGAYGTRTAPDGGTVAAYSCDGGHRGQVMPLCASHRAEIQRRQSSLCPACAYPPEARALSERIEHLQARIGAAWDLGQRAALLSRHDQAAARMTELRDAGIIHNCPLRLIEVS